MNSIEALIELQGTDGMIRDLEREAKDLPRRKAQESARLKGVTAAVEIARNQLEALRARIRETEEDAAASRQRVKELKTQQATSNSNREYQQFAAAIEGLEREADSADARGFVLVEDELPRHERLLKEAEEKLAAERGGVDGFCDELEARLAEVKAELDRLAEERKAKAARVPPKSLLYYERLRTKRWPVVVTLSSDAVCEGCHLKVPPSTEQMVEHKMELVACTNCGRLLYRDL